MSAELNTELLETLVQLLNPQQSSQVRAAAATAAAAQTAGAQNASLRRELGTTSLGKRVLQRLLALMNDGATSRLILTAIVNITEDDTANDTLVELKVIERVITALLDDDQRSFYSLHAAILSNATRSDMGRKALLANELATSRTRSLLGKLRHIPNLLWVSNLAALPDGREILLEKEDGGCVLNTLLLTFLTSKDVTQRHAAASTLRNCAISADCHQSLLQGTDGLGAALARFACSSRPLTADELSLTPAIVREAYEKKNKLTPEPVQEVRIALAEALLLLCQSKEGREALHLDGLYAVLRNWHLEESDPAVKSTIEQIVDRTKLLDEDEEKSTSVAQIEAATAIE